MYIDQNIIIGILVILFCLIIYLKNNPRLKESNPIPNIAENSEDQIGLSIEDVDSRIQELVPNYVNTTDVNGNTFRNTSIQELGFEYNATGDKLIFNKPIDFNNEIVFEDQIDFNARIKVNDGLEGNSSGRDTAMLNIFGDANVTRDFGNGRNNVVNGNLITNGYDTNIKSYNNMIVPFYVNFNNEDNINDLKNKNWYLCDGQEITINRVTRITPDLRGRFIWGGSIDELQDTQLPYMTKPDNTLDTSYTLWGSNSGYVGGEGYHTLTVPEMPDHDHDTEARIDNNRNDGSQSGWHLQNTHNSDEPWKQGHIKVLSKGDGKPHNNLPPYIVLAFFIYWPRPWVQDDEPWSSAIN